MRSKNVSLLVILSGIILATSCNKPSMDNVKIVHTRGLKEIYNMSRSYYKSRSLSDTTTAIAVEDGDLLFCRSIEDKDASHMIIYQYSDQSDEVLTVKPDPGHPFKVNINGDIIVSLYDSTAWNWIGSVEQAGLNDLDAVIINFPVTEDQMEILKVVSKQKPDLNFALITEDTTDQFNAIFSMFKPEWIYLSTYQTFSSEQLSKLSNVKYMIFDNHYGYTKAFDGLSQLTHLRINNSRWQRLNQYSLPQNIESLYFTDCSIADIRTLPGFKNVEALGFSRCPKLLDIRSVKGMKKLKWLACPPNIDQAQFDSLIPTLTSLQVLELIECDALTNLDVVKKLPALKSLTVNCKKIDLATIPAMDKLQLLVIAAENDSITDNKVLALQKKFPDTTVVPGGGFCLGSGWLLLLIPMVVVLIFAFRKLKPSTHG